MRNALVLTLGGVLAIAVVIGAAWHLFSADTPATPENVGSQTAQPQTSSSEGTYLLRAYEGKLAVFTTDYVKPDYVFEVYVKTLPEQDREMLARGVRAADYETLARMVEDYIS